MNRRTVPMVAVALLVSVAVLAGSPAPAKGVVNINTATAEQLALLPRVGPSLAQRIVAFRKANGNFKSTGELVAVRGIGEKSFARLKPYLTTSGPTTLKSKVRLSRSTHRSGAKKTN